MTFAFRVLHEDRTTRARVGELRTTHGVLQTPVFMPVGTQATVKSLTPDDLRALGAQVILGNAYHLYLRPGSDLIQRLGGLHRFMAWDRPILTDSGGFQVFSLGHMRRLDENGVTFRSHIDGSTHLFTPESVTRVQEELGSDIAMVLDECTPYPTDEAEARESFERSTRWAARARRAHTRSDQVQFGIVQGGMYPHLRQESAAQLVDLDFSGYGIGGLSVGEPKELFYAMLAVAATALPPGKPRYVMGVGAPEDLFEAVSNGIDMFDCVLQTRLGRNGALFTRTGQINVRNARFRSDPEPVDPACDCYTCRTFSLAYVHHLFRSEELLAYRLASLHNLRWTVKLVEEMRGAILANRFAALRDHFLSAYKPRDAALRDQQRARWLASRRERKEKLRMLQAVLLDIDGTFLLSNEAHARAWEAAFAEFGYQIAWQRIQPLIGMGGGQLLNTLVPGLTDTEGQGKEIAKRRKEIFLERYAPTLQPAPGGRDLVIKIKDAGLSVVVATTAESDELHVLLQAARLDDLVQETTTSSDVERAKPAPDIVEQALRKAGAEPHTALMIGDTPYDVEAATKAGVPIIALRCGGHSDKELAGASAVYDDPADLLAHYPESPLGAALAAAPHG